MKLSWFALIMELINLFIGVSTSNNYIMVIAGIYTLTWLIISIILFHIEDKINIKK